MRGSVALYSHDRGSLGKGQPVCQAAGDWLTVVVYHWCSSLKLFLKIKGECLTCVISNLIILSILLNLFEVISWSWMLWRLRMMTSDSYPLSYAKPWDPNINAKLSRVKGMRSRVSQMIHDPVALHFWWQRWDLPCILMDFEWINLILFAKHLRFYSHFVKRFIYATLKAPSMFRGLQ